MTNKDIKMEDTSDAMKQAALRLSSGKDGVVAKIRAARDKERQKQSERSQGTPHMSEGILDTVKSVGKKLIEPVKDKELESLKAYWGKKHKDAMDAMHKQYAPSKKNEEVEIDEAFTYQQKLTSLRVYPKSSADPRNLGKIPTTGHDKDLSNDDHYKQAVADAHAKGKEMFGDGKYDVVHTDQRQHTIRGGSVAKVRKAMQASAPKNESVELDEGKVQDVNNQLAAHAQRKIDHEKKYGQMSAADLHSHEVIRTQLLTKKKKLVSAKMRSESVELDEKTLTPAELKKREEVAKAMEKDQPGIDTSNKIAIATAVAKRVAEAEELSELSKKTLDAYRNARLKQHTDHTKPHPGGEKATKGITTAYNKGRQKDNAGAATSAADWYNQASNGRRYMGDSVEVEGEQLSEAPKPTNTTSKTGRHLVSAYHVLKRAKELAGSEHVSREHIARARKELTTYSN